MKMEGTADLFPLCLSLSACFSLRLYHLFEQTLLQPSIHVLGNLLDVNTITPISGFATQDSTSGKPKKTMSWRILSAIKKIPPGTFVPGGILPWLVIISISDRL